MNHLASSPETRAPAPIQAPLSLEPEQSLSPSPARSQDLDSPDGETMESDVEEIHPKIEEIYESPGKLQAPFENENLSSPNSIPNTDNLQTRKRGRPRKSTDLVLAKQNTKLGRSKTGCLTCRRRKKKCDEAKPECKRLQSIAVALTSINPDFYLDFLSLTGCR